MTWYFDNREREQQKQKEYKSTPEFKAHRLEQDRKNKEYNNARRKEWRHGIGKEKDKVQRGKDNSKYYAKVKDTPEFKEKESKRGKIYHENNKERISEYSKKHSQIPEVKERRNETNNIWSKNNPEKVLEKNIRYLSNLAEPVNMDRFEYGVALMSWTKTVMKKFASLCQVCSEKADHSHHVLFKALYPKLSLNINNGIPLCLEHHKEIHRLNTIQRGRD